MTEQTANQTELTDKNEEPKLDLHTPGLYAIASPNGDVIPHTVRRTGHAARADFIRDYSCNWGELEQRGYRIVELKKA